MRNQYIGKQLVYQCIDQLQLLIGDKDQQIVQQMDFFNATGFWIDLTVTMGDQGGLEQRLCKLLNGFDLRQYRRHRRLGGVTLFHAIAQGLTQIRRGRYKPGWQQRRYRGLM